MKKVIVLIILLVMVTSISGSRWKGYIDQTLRDPAPCPFKEQVG